MGRTSFSEAVYLLLTGELPSHAVGRLMDALLVSSIDHGATPPSTLAACNVATTGAPVRRVRGGRRARFRIAPGRRRRHRGMP